jgi:predicted phosphoribosyltransferase
MLVNSLTDCEVDDTINRELMELARREHVYRGDRPPPRVSGRQVILVDDGLATGASMLAAVRVLRALGAGSITVAVPVAAPETCAEFQEEVDQIICAHTPEPFRAVGLWYQDFSQTSDREVRELLARNWAEHGEKR